jgi:hypothetical protein
LRPGPEIGVAQYVRHGTLSISAALNVRTGEVLTEAIARNDAATFISFMRTLDRSIAQSLLTGPSTLWRGAFPRESGHLFA